MTINLFGIKIEIKVTKVETFRAEINQAQRQADAAAIISSEHFQALKEQAARARALRQIADTSFGQQMIENIARG